MREKNIVYLSTLPTSYPLPLFIQFSFILLVVSHFSSDWIKYTKFGQIGALFGRGFSVAVDFQRGGLSGCGIFVPVAL